MSPLPKKKKLVEEEKRKKKAHLHLFMQIHVYFLRVQYAVLI